MALEAETLCFERQCSATSKGIVKGGQLVSIKQFPRTWMVDILRTGSPPALPDFRACPVQHFFVGGVLPLHEVLNDAKEALALLLLCLQRSKDVWVARWIVDHLRKNHRPRRRERPLRPPLMDR